MADQIEVDVEGEGLADIETILIDTDSRLSAIIVAVSAKNGIAVEELLLFGEDGEEPLDPETPVVAEVIIKRVHHVHRARQIEVTVFYKAESRSKTFPPSTRVLKVLDWAVGPHGFNIDPAIAPEMELALHGQTAELPKHAHIGRYVHHPHHHLTLDLIRGVVPNG